MSTLSRELIRVVARTLVAVMNSGDLDEIEHKRMHRAYRSLILALPKPKS